MPEHRPVSPFLILLFGAAATALAAEWLRFGWGPALAILPLVLGGGATLYGVRRSFLARRRLRAGRERPVPPVDAASEPVRIAGGPPAHLAYAGSEAATRADVASADGVRRPAARTAGPARAGGGEHRPARTPRPPVPGAAASGSGPGDGGTAPSPVGARSR